MECVEIILRIIIAWLANYFKKLMEIIMLKYIFAAVLVLNVSISNAATYQVLSGSISFDSVNTFSIPGIGSFTEGVFDGSASACCIGADVTATNSGFGSADLWSIPMTTYFSTTGVDGLNHNAPSIDLNSMTADFGSFYAYWNGQEIYQGGSASVVDLGNSIYELTWAGSEFTGGVKVSPPTAWTMQVSAVPVPAAVWLFASGFIALFGFARPGK